MENNDFNGLGLNSKVLSSINSLGFVKPSKIQSEIIPYIIDGFDVLGQAPTGTGKTLAYTSSILSELDVSGNVVKAIILTPTRELALQVCNDFETINTSSGFDILAVYGGSSIENQIRALKKGVDIVVGTPGRIMDLIERKVLKINDLEYFVLDEADEMLNMGFLEDIEFIFKHTNSSKNVLLFSATMPDSILKLAKKYMNTNYKHVCIEDKSRTSINVKQSYYLINEKNRCEALCRVVDVLNPKLAIIFCQTKRDCDKLLTELSTRNYSVEAMHGDIAQAARIQTLERFKLGAFQFLIATDVAARGIHVDNIDMVINYNMPQDYEAYIHRIGRTGRAGNSGIAINFVTRGELRFLKEVQKYAKCEINESTLPTVNDIYESKFRNVMDRVNSIIDDKSYEDKLVHVRDMNKGELMNFSAALLKVVIDKEIGSNLNKEIILKEDRRKTVSDKATRVFLTIGKLDKLKKGTLLDFLKSTTNIRKECFNNIEILNKFTFMDVDNNEVDHLISSLYNKKLNGRVIRVELAKRK